MKKLISLIVSMLIISSCINNKKVDFVQDFNQYHVDSAVILIDGGFVIPFDSKQWTLYPSGKVKFEADTLPHKKDSVYLHYSCKYIENNVADSLQKVFGDIYLKRASQDIINIKNKDYMTDMRDLHIKLYRTANTTIEFNYYMGDEGIVYSPEFHKMLDLLDKSISN